MKMYTNNNNESFEFKAQDIIRYQGGGSLICMILL